MFNFESLFESAPDAMLLIDKDGQVVLVNSQLESLFGYSKSELVGEQVEMLIPPSLHSRHRIHREIYNRNPRIRPMGEKLSLKGLHKNQSQFLIEISLAPIEGGYSAATIRPSRSSFFQNRWKWAIIPIIGLHLAQGILLSFFETAGNTTSTSTLMTLVPDHTIAGIILVMVALLSIYQLATGTSKWLFLPQFFMLIIAMGGAVLAISNSAFADGVVRSRAFIAADQLIYIILPWIYGIVILEIHQTQFRISLGDE